MNKKINDLSYTNPIVNNCLHWHKYGNKISYVQALEQMVIMLAESEMRYKEELALGYSKNTYCLSVTENKS